MRLDLRRNGIEHIVSRLWGVGGAGAGGGWGGGQDPIKPPTCSAGKGVDQKAGAEEGGCSLVDRNGHAGSWRACKSSEEEWTWRLPARGRNVSAVLLDPHSLWGFGFFFYQSPTFHFILSSVSLSVNFTLICCTALRSVFAGEARLP